MTGGTWDTAVSCGGGKGAGRRHEGGVEPLALSCSTDLKSAPRTDEDHHGLLLSLRRAQPGLLARPLRAASAAALFCGGLRPSGRSGGGGVGDAGGAASGLPAEHGCHTRPAARARSPAALCVGRRRCL